MKDNVKREILETSDAHQTKQNNGVSNQLVQFIEVSSSSGSDSGSNSDDDNEDVEGPGSTSGPPTKRMKMLDDLGVVLPVGFLEPLPALERYPVATREKAVSVGLENCKQFWKAGDYEGAPSGDWDFSTGNLLFYHKWSFYYF